MSTIDGTVIWGLKKSTRMNITRYLDTMKRMLLSNIQGEIQFKPLPSNIILYDGTMNRILDTVDNNLLVKLNLRCEKVTGEENTPAGIITLTGMSRLGQTNLSFQEILATNVNWKSKKDPSHTKLQSQDLTIPLTQLEIKNMGGTFKITFYNNVKQWKPMVEITEAMDKINLDKKLQDVNIRQQFLNGQQYKDEEGSNHGTNSGAKERYNHCYDSFEKETFNQYNNSLVMKRSNQCNNYIAKEKYSHVNNSFDNRATRSMCSHNQLDIYQSRQGYQQTESYVNECFNIKDQDDSIDNTISAVTDTD